MTGTASRPRAIANWARLMELGLVLRIVAADAVQWLATRRGTRCLFPDTDLYWMLGTALRRGEPYETSQWGVPHFALRAPAYPLFLATCQLVFGDRTFPARLVQSALGAMCVLFVFRLVKRAVGATAGSTPAWVAAALTACDPWTISISTVLLSEALYLPLMLLGLWGLAALWNESPARRAGLIAFGTGLAWGAATLAKPSWALFPPGVLAIAILASRSRRAMLARSLLVALGIAVIMAPWWARNYHVFGKFVPTALWSGASLYDGLNPRATGASDMRFLDTPEMQPMTEEAQDALLAHRALGFAREYPARVLELAAVKAWRYWCPWPNASGVRSTRAAIVGASLTLPIYFLTAIGLWDRRRDLRALALLAGPLLYFAAIHMVFVSSVRYRLPAMVPAFGLAGLGLTRLMRKWPVFRVA